MSSDPSVQTTLIVDDDDVNRRLMISMVKAGGYMAQAVASGEEALRVTPDILPDIVLLDVKMPNMDGFEVCKRLKDNPQTSHIPVIYVTAIGYQINADMLALADGYLIKPIKTQQLLDKIREHI